MVGHQTLDLRVQVQILVPQLLFFERGFEGSEVRDCDEKNMLPTYLPPPRGGRIKGGGESNRAIPAGGLPIANATGKEHCLARVARCEPPPFREGREPNPGPPASLL
jgi:hypothetical protein